MTYQRSSYAVWELTLACNLKCQHCGSRAGKPRHDELDTKEALDLVDQLAELGITEVTIEGGEAFLRRDWLEIVEAIVAKGMICTMVTGGYGVSLETARRMKRAGISAVTVSVDGLEATHDRLRGRDGSWRSALRTLSHLREVGIPFTCNTQINRLSAPELPQLYEALKETGFRGWQIQLTQPMGNAADHQAIVLQPAELLELYPMLARVVARAVGDGVYVAPGSNIGYFGPFEALFRRGTRWVGCHAGLSAIGIHADGEIKGCPSLPREYVGGNVRHTRLEQLVDAKELAFNHGAGTAEGVSHLRGFCATCPHAMVCRGGCTAMTSCVTGRRGDNPYCHYRALTLQSQGQRERIVPKLVAIGRPFDHGSFTVLREPIDAPWPEDDQLHFTSESMRWPGGIEAWPLPRPEPGTGEPPRARRSGLQEAVVPRP